jgi:uncharacterized protein (DUF1800 family)
MKIFQNNRRITLFFFKFCIVLLCCTGYIFAEFDGNATSLAPYKETLTRSEVRHILDKVAFGGSKELEDIGLNRGLTALVNALVDGLGGIAYENELNNEGYYWASQHYFYFNDVPEMKGYRVWTDIALRSGQLARFIATRNPLKEWMVLQLGAHFAINTARVGFAYDWYKHIGLDEYWRRLRNYSLGNLRTLAHSMYYDPMMNYWLDNKDNANGDPNQNYSRELMELFLLGTVDPLTKKPNYTEDDVKSATAFASGYKELSRKDSIMGKDVIAITYDPARHDPNRYKLFSSIPGASFEGNLTPFGLVDRILNNHPGAPRYLAERFGGMMLYPGLPESVVSVLAATLKSNNYELKPFIKQILKSQALFSKASQRSCLSSPIEFGIRLLRKLRGTPLSRTGEGREASDFLFWSFMNNIFDAGQGLFTPPSVFAWKGSCNINRDGVVSKGEGWIQAQQLIKRNLMCADIINYNSLTKSDLATLIGIKSMTKPEDIVRKVAGSIFGIALTPSEISRFSKFLTTWVEDNGTQQTIPMYLNDSWYVNKKIGRLICSISQLADSQRR